MSSRARADIDAVIRHTLEDRNIAYGRVGTSGYDIKLENTKHLTSAVRLLIGDQSLLVEVFFVRRPADNAEEFYRFLLERNGRMYGVHFAIDAKGDVYLIGRLPLIAVTSDEIGRLLGCVVAYADDSYEAAHQLGLVAGVRREWDWNGWQGQPSPPPSPSLSPSPSTTDEAHQIIDLTTTAPSMTSPGRHRRS